MDARSKRGRRRTATLNMFAVRKMSGERPKDYETRIDKTKQPPRGRKGKQ